MKVEIKQQVNNQWISLDLKCVVGQSLSGYMLANMSTPMVAAVYETGKKAPSIFISNRQNLVDAYKDKGLSMNIKDLQLLLGERVEGEILLKEFPDSKLFGVEALDTEEVAKVS